MRYLLPLLLASLMLVTVFQPKRINAAPLPPNALPTGGVISAGSATVSTNFNRMQINQGSDRVALNWNSFNVGANTHVNFQQPSASSVALVRVAGNNPSQISGLLTSNGKVILVNPNGVVFVQGAQINAGGLIASTKAISDADFMYGNYRFSGGGQGTVQNDGNIVASPGGQLLLMADNVIHSGQSKAPAGTVGLLAGTSMQVAPDWQAVTVIPNSAAGANDVVINNSGVIDVSAAQGGNLVLNGGASGVTQSSGQLLAAGASGIGGQVRVLGYNVGLISGSVTDASGQSGGGVVLVGGNWQGSGPEVHANAAYLDQSASIKADALGNGNGGKVVLWSDAYTKVDGTISARGGPLGGNGGQVETSSHGNLVTNSVADATAPKGSAGSWLLGPTILSTVIQGKSPSP